MAKTTAKTAKVVPLKPRTTKKTAAKKTTKKAAAKKPATKKAAPAAKKSVAKTTTKKAVAKNKTNPKKVAAVKKEAKAITKKKITKKAAPKKVVAKKSAVKKVSKPAAKKTKIAARKTAAKPKTQTKPQVTRKPQIKKTETIIMTQPNFAPQDFEKAQAQFDQFTKEAANLNREGIDAFVKSGTIFAKGFESIIRESIGFAQSTAEKQMQLAKDAMTSKTINEFSDAQNKIAQTSFDDFMSGTTKITELGVKVLTEAIEPINDQIAKSVQKATDAVAAE